MSEDSIEKKYLEISNKYKLNPDTMWKVFLLRNMGVDNNKIAQKAHICRDAVDKHVAATKKMSLGEIKSVMMFVATMEEHRW